MSSTDTHWVHGCWVLGDSKVILYFPVGRFRFKIFPSKTNLFLGVTRLFRENGSLISTVSPTLYIEGGSPIVFLRMYLLSQKLSS